MEKTMAGLFFGAAAISVCGLLLPHGKLGETGKRILSVLFAAALFFPLAKAVMSTDFRSVYAGFSEENANSRTLYSEVGEAAFAAGLSKALCERFSLPEGSVAVELSGYRSDTVTAASARVTLGGGAGSADPLKIAAFVRQNGVEVCEVEFTF